MGDIQTRPFSKNYSGLINQSVIAVGITVLCVGGHEYMKRKRRGKKQYEDGLGSRESWQFGYLYQGRSWARKPSPPSPKGWILSWVPQAVWFPEAKMNEIRGIDATLYIRFLRGCFWFALLHTLTTFPVLFPIHVEFSEPSIDPKSMTRASISSLVSTEEGLSLLWIHICLLFWITLTWIGTLFWIAHGAFMLRAENIKQASKRVPSGPSEGTRPEHHLHPHPQFNFASVPSLDFIHPTNGLRLRTIMVSNVPPQLRDEKVLKEYFEYYMSRKLERPALGLTATTQPGFFNKSFAFLFNRAKRLPVIQNEWKDRTDHSSASDPEKVPAIDRVVVARKMTELASLLERREDILRLLETAHIKLARTTLEAVKKAMQQKEANKPFSRSNSRAKLVAKERKSVAGAEQGDAELGGPISEEERMEQLIKVLGPFVDEFELRRHNTKLKKASHDSKHAFQQLRTEGSADSDNGPMESPAGYPPTSANERRPKYKITIWEALLSLPRSSLDVYQPLVNLSHLFRGKTVPSIDYYTAKLNLLTSLITENRTKPATKFDPVSTAFVTFADPDDARKACKYLAVHPHNPLTCSVTMAPEYQDLDWIRVMKSSFDAEFVKDWVVSVGVWAFTIFWLFPVSLLVGLVSIQNISVFWPSLKAYLDKHAWEEEVIQSFLPTLLVALLALLIPLILLLIAKKAHTITTLSALHDRIMTRYYKFLIVNVLVFFCVGTAALQSILNSFRASATTPDILQIVADSFPSAGPFYVGWLIFTTAMHGGFEIILLGLPLIMYPTTKRQLTPRKRAIGIRPRTFNFYYWLPTHLLVIHVLMLFAVLNPVVLPFGAFYFFIEAGVIKNQLIHVYAKNYEGDGKLILIRMLRYSLDGLILSQAVFLAYMVVLKKNVNVALSAVLIVFTAVVKLIITRMCRAQFERDDIQEAHIVCGQSNAAGIPDIERGEIGNTEQDMNGLLSTDSQRRKSIWQLPAWVTLSYATIRHHPNNPLARGPNPFRAVRPSFSHRGSRQSQAEENQRPSRLATGSAVEPPLLVPSSPIAPPLRNEHDFAGPVVPHPSPVSWDDLTTADLPYDNPYYTRAISNVLWLPRNPCGLLDLDDTIDLKTSITVEASAGKLGTWIGIPETDSPLQMSTLSLHPSHVSLPPSERRASSFAVDGTEEIDLPPAIARRIESKEGDIEQATGPRRPSTLRVRHITSQKQPSMSSMRPPIKSFRSYSEVIEPMKKRSNSLLSFFESPQLGSTGRPGSSNRLASPHSSPRQLSLRPNMLAQGDFVTANASRMSMGAPPQLRRAENISAHHAILREVMAEEESALVNRLEEEDADAEKATTKSRFTSWMFKKARNNLVQ
ncbi:uncharacterized protein BT62DRAFT_567336 [Guyanagaster necrorhizus]|uniref:DUF221-domain-containing protein n=1 Tax=Guyanagaster necrorhizus TaxID=856835 RepID=A0A9P7VH17_9AGAR|nr:uncharacterized protein BT62DRAFT_567336 [Guyanagaster necrorhizus MCA 3950]KAG7440881.1 hypothetical protein BT62DRAFT_567336 [Guyanagaster necrorhizus MCA 3950]